MNDTMLCKRILFLEELYIDSITTIFFLIFSIVFTRYLPAYLTSSRLYLKYTNSSFLSSHKPFPLTSTCTKLKQKKDILSFHFRCFISFHDISLFLSFWVETKLRRFLFSKIDSSSTSDLLCWLFLLLMLLLTNSVYNLEHCLISLENIEFLSPLSHSFLRPWGSIRISLPVVGSNPAAICNLNKGSCCGFGTRVVASDTRGSQFETLHQHILYITFIYCWSWKEKQK